jgi:O-succinylbenzoic acid--CoA ligase
VSARISEEYRAGLEATLMLDVDCPPDCNVILTTSGSTGQSKAVMHTWSAIEHATYALHERLGGPGGWLCALPLHTSAGFMTVARAAIADTATAAVASLAGAMPFTADAFVRGAATLDAHRRYTSLVPEMAQRLLGDAQGIAALQSFDAVLIGGQAIPKPLVSALRDAGVKVVLSYGMTETCGGCVYDGVPLSGVGVGFDAQRVQISGPVVMLGYRSDARPQTAQSVRTFTTSDFGHIDDSGCLVIDGRADDVVIVNGVNVSLSAVEAALRDLGISAVACADDSHLFAAAISSLSPDEITAAAQRIRETLAVRIDLRVVPEIPLTAAGKPDRGQLTRMLAAQS